MNFASVDSRIYQYCPDYNPKYLPMNYLNIQQLDYQAYEEFTKDFMLDDEIPPEIMKISKMLNEQELEWGIDIMVRDFTGDDLYKITGVINILDKGIRPSSFEIDKLDIMAGGNVAIYYKFSDIFAMKTIANLQKDAREQDRMMLNIFFYMYNNSVRNNKILSIR